ncbi:MAG: T9SS type A sorting domain-containing protein, partial [Saprospiraceae bacterium]
FELLQNVPNPWRDETVIPFRLAHPGLTRISVTDVAGRVVYRHEEHFTAGLHEFAISNNDLPTIGIFYYTVESSDWKATRKMVLAD